MSKVAKFVEFWKSQRGSEKGEDQKFWNSLLSDVLGVGDITSFIQYQVPVHFKGTTKFLDAWIPSTRVLIEHKTRGVDLDAPQAGHDGQTPFQQAWDYDNNRPMREKARWIVVCNFDEIRIHDMEADVPETTFELITLESLSKESHRLKFLIQSENAIRARELEVSVKAGRVVGKLYNSFLETLAPQLSTPNSQPSTPNSQLLTYLNKLCVRLIFCVYAEDAGVFAKDQFLDFLRKFHYGSFHLQLAELFKVLRLKPEERGPFISDELKAFPYVGGGLFKEDIPIAPFSEKTAKILLDDASEAFDWSEISPTIFGAVFESTLNPETRRKDGMHYTSEENIHRLIDPLFFDGLKAEFAAIKAEPNLKKRTAALIAFQEKLGDLRFLDPACGSGNFLTETYISLRKLENEALKVRFGAQGQFDLEDKKLIYVSINQFYGIEINDFAVTVAQTAMWIAECKMMQETNAILSKNFTPLPLTDSAKIIEGNALHMDWGENLRLNERLPDAHFDYIMGNPPFVGHQYRSREQAADMDAVYADWNDTNYGKLDYVCAWYKRSLDCLQSHTGTHCAFVSTNSICQGESVAAMWKPLVERGNLTIDFAWRPFVWDSEALEKAHVHVVIIGFHVGDVSREVAKTRRLFASDGSAVLASNINGYLYAAPNVFIQNRGGSLTAGFAKMSKGSQPTDGGNLILTQEEREEIIAHWHKAETFIKRYLSADDYINNHVRYCLWLKDVEPNQYRDIPMVMDRLSKVAELRRKSPTKSVQKDADTPMLFTQIRQPDSDYLVVPEVSSQRRKYIPIGFLSPENIVSNMLYVIPNASLLMFGVMASSVHMAWMRVVCGRLKSDYRYTPAVYNNFPWPDSTSSTPLHGQNSNPCNPCNPWFEKISQTAQAILDARALYPDSSLADLYDPLTMPPDLRRAHQANDAAVLAAYGFPSDLSESEIVSRLFEMYARLTAPSPHSEP